MTFQKNGDLCYCCNAVAASSIMLVDQDGRIYIPNQMVRERGHACLQEIWFCKGCMRAIEDALRATIQYRIDEAHDSGGDRRSLAVSRGERDGHDP